ncbi:MAG: hypothetical protein U1D30_22545 [Planctomycetota bacterium]
MNRGILMAAILGIGVGVAIPFLRQAREESVTIAKIPSALSSNDSVASDANATESAVAPAVTNSVESAPVPVAQPAESPKHHQMTEAEIIAQVRRDNQALKQAQDQYFATADKERKISDKEFRQEQAQANIRSKQNLAAKQLQAEIDNASEYEYNPVHSAFGAWTSDDWGAINHYSGGYIWGR